MTHVLLVATTTGYQIRSFGEAAARAGVRLTIVSDRCDHFDDPWRDGAVPVRFHEPDASVENVVRGLAADPPVAVLAVGDRPATFAASLAHALGLPGNPPMAAATSRNKLATKQALREGLLPIPAFRVERIDMAVATVARTLTYPVVVKPLALSGSRGVIRADTPAAFEAAVARVRRILESADVRAERDVVHDQLLIEAFVPGREFAVEGVLTSGRLQVLTIFDKPDPLDGPFFEETIYITPSRESTETQGAICEAVARATHALGLTHGPIHAECRVNEAGVFVLEVAARPIGGLCSKALRFTSPDGTARSLEDLVLAHALGGTVSGWTREHLASGVMMIPIPRRGIYRGVEGVEAALAVPGVEDLRITAKADALVVPLPEGRSYLGFVFARGATPDEAEQALRDAHGRLHFAIDRAIDVL